MSRFLPRVPVLSEAPRVAAIWIALFTIVASTACLDSNMDGGGGGPVVPDGPGTPTVFSEPDPSPTGNPGAAGAIDEATRCVVDAIGGVAETGSIGLPFDSADIVALCDGWVLIADTTNNRIELRNIFTGLWDTRWDLPGAPDDLELDAHAAADDPDAHPYVYATLPDQNLVVAIDLTTGTDYVATTNTTPTSITQTENQLLVAAGDGGELRAYRKPQPELDRALEFLGLDRTLAGTHIIYNETADQLIGISDTNITLFGYTETEVDVVLTPTVFDDPSNGAVLDLDLSPDDSRIAFVNPGGNASFAGSSVINDISTANVDTVMGAWKVEINPTSASFNPIGGEDYLLATSANDYVIFDFARHAEITRSTPTSACSGSFDESEFSAGGDVAISKMSCDGTGTEIHWFAPAGGFGNSNSTIGVPAGILAATIGDPFCSTDALGAVTPLPSGSLTIPLAEDFEPFCDGWMFLTERGTNRVLLKNVITNVTAAEWDLHDLPVEMVVDEANQFLFVATGAVGGLARIELAGAGAGTLVETPAPGFPQSISLGIGGDVWTTGFFEPSDVHIVNTDGLTMTPGGVFTPSEIFSSATAQIAFDRTNNPGTGVLFVSSAGDGLASFEETPGLTYTQIDVDNEIFHDLDSQIVMASPDGFSIAIVDQVADLIFDLETGHTQDLTDTFWVVESLLDMTAIAFDGLGNRLGVATTEELIVFDANGAHDEIVTLQPATCDVDIEARPGVSRGNDVGFYKSDCGSVGTLTETIFWWAL